MDRKCIEFASFFEGLLTACSEKTNKKWLRRWCMVKGGQLEIFSDNGEDVPEMTIVLSGCDIQNAMVNKRQLAIRLVKEGKELVILDVSTSARFCSAHLRFSLNILF